MEPHLKGEFIIDKKSIAKAALMIAAATIPKIVEVILETLVDSQGSHSDPLELEDKTDIK